MAWISSSKSSGVRRRRCAPFGRSTIDPGIWSCAGRRMFLRPITGFRRTGPRLPRRERLSPDGLLKIALPSRSQPHFERSEKSASSRNQRVAINGFLVTSPLGMRLGNFYSPLSRMRAVGKPIPEKLGESRRLNLVVVPERRELLVARFTARENRKIDTDSRKNCVDVDQPEGVRRAEHADARSRAGKEGEIGTRSLRADDVARMTDEPQLIDEAQF